MSFGQDFKLQKVDKPHDNETKLKIVQTFGDYYLADVSEVTPGGPTPGFEAE